MNEFECRSTIEGHLMSSSPCGTAFKYSDDSHSTDVSHIKIVVCHDDQLKNLYVVSTTSKFNSAFRYSPDIDDILELSSQDYDEFKVPTYIICSDIEEISFDDLVKKCLYVTPGLELKSAIKTETLKEIHEKILGSKHSRRGYKKLVQKCFEYCGLKSAIK